MTEKHAEDQKPDEIVPEEVSLETQVQDLKDQLLRALADGENTRKRLERERDELRKYAVTSFARDLLTVGDNLGRALESAPNAEMLTPETLKSFLEGVEMTERELLAILERHGITKIHPEGEAFNHEHHQAMFEVDSQDHGPGVVAQVLQPGYLIHDRLLRPALVGVTKKASEEGESS